MLFTKDDLTAFLAAPVGAEQAVMVERIVAGWLAAEGLTSPALARLAADEERDVPESVFAWAVELGGLLVDNPTSMSTDGTADQTQGWFKGRREEILAKVSAYARGAGLAPATATVSAVPAPRGRFPRARRYPESADDFVDRRYRRW